MGEATGIDNVGSEGFQMSRAKDIFRTLERIPIPQNWTILHHGSNLGRDEWQGTKRNVLDADSFINQARGRGLSCITDEERQEQAAYDTTRGFSTVPAGFKDEPLELRIAFPAFHSRTKLANEGKEQYRQKYGTERMERILELADKVHWRLNEQHPVVPRGVKLVKLQDFVDPQGRRVISYVPEELRDIYDRELAKS